MTGLADALLADDLRAYAEFLGVTGTAVTEAEAIGRYAYYVRHTTLSAAEAAAHDRLRAAVSPLPTRRPRWLLGR